MKSPKLEKNCSELCLEKIESKEIEIRSKNGYTVFPHIVAVFFFGIVKPWKFQIVSSLIFPLCNKNLNSFLTGVRKLFKGGKYSREETIWGNTVFHLFYLPFINVSETRERVVSKKKKKTKMIEIIDFNCFIYRTSSYSFLPWIISSFE